ncbi:hypothetical protein DRJ16_07445, partial [Candidatus Woesearchaeota archaeon]
PLISSIACLKIYLKQKLIIKYSDCPTFTDAKILSSFASSFPYCAKDLRQEFFRYGLGAFLAHLLAFGNQVFS